jgi:hypothetical protein
MRLSRLHRLPLSFDIGPKDARAIKNSGMIGSRLAHELKRLHQSPLWLAIIWKLFVPIVAIVGCGFPALGAAVATYAVIQLT